MALSDKTAVLPAGLFIECAGCGGKIAKAPLNKPEPWGVLWCRSEFGLTVLRVHRDQDCAKQALAATGYKMCKGNRPPMPAAEREEWDRARAERA